MDLLPLKVATVLKLALRAHVVKDRAAGWVNTLRIFPNGLFHGLL